MRSLVADELSQPVDPRVIGLAKAIASEHGDASRAVLFYGSCLRQKQLEGLMLDFYLIVSDYRAAYAKRWLATANRLIPPNVFYFERDGLRAKYAVLSEADFLHECLPEAWNVSTAARFAQPSRLVWSSDAGAAETAIATVSHAAPTLLGWTAPLAPPDVPPLDLWKRAFQLTFNAELRAERSDRSAMIVDSEPERYRRFATAARAAAESSTGAASRWWRKKQLKGKAYSVVRLAKASATFAGGPDYIAWKVNRHAGTNIQLKPWQRRWPLLAAITLLPRLLKTGSVR